MRSQELLTLTPLPAVKSKKPAAQGTAPSNQSTAPSNARRKAAAAASGPSGSPADLAPGRSALGQLARLDGATAAHLIAGISDLTLLIDKYGVVRQAHAAAAPLQALCAAWVGQSWEQSVTSESTAKVQALLDEALSQGNSTRWRQVNHRSAAAPGADDWPITYMTTRATGLGATPLEPMVVAAGRDLSATAQLQRRLVDSQQSMERDYGRFREAETRYRSLFQTSMDAVLIADNPGLKIQEANPAAEALLGKGGTRLVGANLAAWLQSESTVRLQAALAQSRSDGRTARVRLRLSGSAAAAAPAAAELELTASLFRQEVGSYWLLRLWPVDLSAGKTPSAAGLAAEEAHELPGPAGLSRWLHAYAQHAADGLVFTDAQGRILMANTSFAGQAQLGSPDAARGEPLDRWLGATGVELAVVMGQLRQKGSVGLVSTRLRGEFGAQLDVEVAASALPLDRADEAPARGANPARAERLFAFAVRDIGRRLQSQPAPSSGLSSGSPLLAESGAAARAVDKVARSATELTELVGRVPMKDIVSETGDLIEKLCIETALQMTGDNRALAAQLLGLSRQSLYVKLRRYGLGDLDRDSGSEAAAGDGLH